MLALPGASDFFNFGKRFLGLAPTGPMPAPTSPAPLGTTPAFPRPRPPAYAVDQVLQQIWPNPWYGPNDLDPAAGIEPEQRALYLGLYKKEPILNAAIERKVAGISTLDITVHAADEDNPRDVEAAQFIDAAVRGSDQGWIGLFESILRPGFIFGWSVAEIKLKEMTRGKFRGRWGLDHVRSLNTEPFIRLQLDVYRNITGVVNLIRGIQDYAPSKFVFFTNKWLFHNPFGQSDVQPAERASRLFKEVLQVWYIALKRYGLPYMHGQVANPNYRQMLEQALEDLQGSGWAVTGIEDKITVVNTAAAAASSGFEAMIDKLSEHINFGVSAESMSSQVSSNKGGDNRGDTGVSKETGLDPVRKLQAFNACRAINQWLVPVLMGPNFGPEVGMPYVVAAGIDYAAIKNRLEVINLVEQSGRKVSSEEVYKAANVKPAEPGDPVMSQSMPGMPGAAPPGSPGPPGATPPAAPGAGPNPPEPPPPESPAKPGPAPVKPKPGQPAPAGGYTPDQVKAAVDALLKEFAEPELELSLEPADGRTFAAGHQSGVFTDSAGRRYRLQDGRRVPLGESRAQGDAGNPHDQPAAGARKDLRARWAEYTSDPDLDHRIHNHPAGHSGGGYNRSTELGNKVGNLHAAPSVKAALAEARKTGSSDVTLTPELLAAAHKETGGRGKPDASLHGVRLRFDTGVDHVGRTNALTHVLPARGDIAAAIGGFGGGAVAGMYQTVADSIKQTGDVPSPERKAGSAFAQMWDRVKAAGLHTHPEAADRFVKAMQEGAKAGGKGQHYAAALNKHFADAKPAESRPNPDLDAAMGEPAKAPAAPAAPLRHNPDLDAAFGETPKPPTPASPPPPPPTSHAKTLAWIESQSDRHSAAVGRMLGADPIKARALLSDGIRRAVGDAIKNGIGSIVITGPNGKRLRLTVRRKAKTFAAVGDDFELEFADGA